MIHLYSFHSPLVFMDYSFFSIGKGDANINLEQTEKLFDSNGLAGSLKSLLDTPGKKNESLALLLSGPFIDHLQKKEPRLIQRVSVGLKSGEIILLASPYHLSMASLYSNNIFIEDINAHKSQLKRVFNYEAKIVYNPASMYFDDLAGLYKDLGFEYALAPSSAWHLNHRSPTQLFKSKGEEIKLLLTTPENQTSDGIVEVVNGSRKRTKSGLSSNLTAILDSEPTESYLVPYPISDQVTYVTRNSLQNSVIREICFLEKKIIDQNKNHLISDLCLFTSIDSFLLLNNDQALIKRPYDHYISMMNMLSNFEIVNEL